MNFNSQKNERIFNLSSITIKQAFLVARAMNRPTSRRIIDFLNESEPVTLIEISNFLRLDDVKVHLLVAELQRAGIIVSNRTNYKIRLQLDYHRIAEIEHAFSILAD